MFQFKNCFYLNIFIWIETVFIPIEYYLFLWCKAEFSKAITTVSHDPWENQYSNLDQEKYIISMLKKDFFICKPWYTQKFGLSILFKKY